MKLWLDDVRPLPSGYDVWVPDSISAINLIKTGLIDEVSLDHDLNYFDDTGFDTGYNVASYIEEMARQKKLRPIIWHIHSINPAGARRMELALRNANEYWGIENKRLSD